MDVITNICYQLLTSEDNILELSISDDESLVAVGSSDCVISLAARTGSLVYKSGLSESVSCLAWCGESLYVGGGGGCVAVVDGGGAVRQILALDSKIVQIATQDDLLVASTCTKCVICNISLKTFREVGSKPRQGEQGVAILERETWAARPGCRIWEVDQETGAVLSTRQFRKALNDLAPTPVIHWNNGKYGFGGEHGFSLLNSNDNGITVTHSHTGRIYLLDMKNSGVLAWTSVSPSVINKTYIQGNLAVVLDTLGAIKTITFSPLVDLIQASYDLEKFVLCSDILLSNRNTIKSLPFSDITKILTLRDLGNNLTDKERVAKVRRLMDAMDTFVGKSLSGVYTRQISSEQILTHRDRNSRSVSQDRRRGLNTSNEILSSGKNSSFVNMGCLKN